MRSLYPENEAGRFGPRRDEVTVEWRRLHNEELNGLYCSPNIVRVIKSRRMRWAGHVARMGEETGRIGSWWGNRRERDHWGDLGVDGWVILGWISRRWDVDWIELAQDRDRWRALVSAVMNRTERDHWGDQGVAGWIILGWISRRWDVGMWTGLGWPRIGTGSGRL